MVETIAPVVHGGRRSRWWVSVALHALGATLAAATLGAVMGGFGALVGAPWGRAGLLAVAAMAGLYAAGELTRLKAPIPDRRRQVPEWWRTYFPAPAASFLYGLGLGVGFLTYLGHGTLVAVAVAAVATGDPLVGAVLVAPFGLARGLSVVGSRRGTSGTAIGAAVDRLERLAQTRAPALANGIVLVVLGMTAAVVAVGAGGTASSGLGAWVLAAVFSWAAVAKLIDREAWTQAVSAFGLGSLEGPAAIGVPLLEAGVAGLVVAGSPVAGAALSLGLLAAFTVAIFRARARVGDRVPCGCFGRTARRDVRLVLFRNAALAALAALVVAAPGTGWALRWPEPSELLPAAMVGAAAILTGLILRELSRMPERQTPR
jgi:hypothetical protein